MYSEMERRVMASLKSAGPRTYGDQQEQFARSLPLLAGLSVVLVGVLGGWVGEVFALGQLLLVAPASIVDVLVAPFFWLDVLPPFLWLASIYPLTQRRLLGWRLFVLGTALSLIAFLLQLNLISILFSAAILYFTLQCYDAFDRRYY
jgi:hypothetical protein